MSLFAIAFSILRAFLKSKTDMAAENLCLRQHVAVLSLKSGRILAQDEVGLSVQRPRRVLALADPEKQDRWHRRAFPNLKKKPRERISP